MLKLAKDDKREITVGMGKTEKRKTVEQGRSVFTTQGMGLEELRVIVSGKSTYNSHVIERSQCDTFSSGKMKDVKQFCLS